MRRDDLEDRFVALLRERWRRGDEEYGDRSFSQDPKALLDEIGQELLDVCGWAFVLWVRLERMRHALFAFDDCPGEGIPNQSATSKGDC